MPKAQVKPCLNIRLPGWGAAWALSSPCCTVRASLGAMCGRCRLRWAGPLLQLLAPMLVLAPSSLRPLPAAASAARHGTETHAAAARGHL